MVSSLPSSTVWVHILYMSSGQGYARKSLVEIECCYKQYAVSFIAFVVCSLHKAIFLATFLQFFLQQNDDDWKTLQVAEVVSHICNTFSQLARCLLETVYNSFSGCQREISLLQKMSPDWLILTKLHCKVRLICHTQQLVSQHCKKLTIVLLSLQLAM